MNAFIAQWVTSHSILICLVGTPLLVIEGWWIVRAFRNHLKDEREMRAIHQERRRELKMVLIRLWASIKKAEEWEVDTTEAVSTFNSIIDSRKESEQLDTLLFLSMLPTILTMFICFIAAWINEFILEIAMG